MTVQLKGRQCGAEVSLQALLTGLPLQNPEIHLNCKTNPVLKPLKLLTWSCLLMSNSQSPAPVRGHQQDESAKRGDDGRKRRSADRRGRVREEHSPHYREGDGVCLRCCS